MITINMLLILLKVLGKPQFGRYFTILTNRTFIF